MDDWTIQYDADELPTVAIPAWTRSPDATKYTESVSDGILNMTTEDGGALPYYIDPYSFDSDTGFTIEMRIRINTAGSDIDSFDGFDMNAGGIGANDILYDFVVADGIIGLATYAEAQYVMDTSDYHVYRITAQGSTVKVYVDGVLRITQTIESGALAGFLWFFLWSGNVTDVDVDYIYVSITGAYPPPTPTDATGGEIVNENIPYGEIYDLS